VGSLNTSASAITAESLEDQSVDDSKQADTTSNQDDTDDAG
tara:strand:+ start:1042 stop:1164 length:123 start_codon:yes stop_codon:yes gene_type:complete